MYFFEIIFWISCFIIFFNYAGYAIILGIINKLNNKNRISSLSNQGFTPGVSFIVAAYNEEAYIEQKIINSLKQNYPASEIEFIFITDGSTDNTPDLIEKYPSIILLHEAARRGKTAALNRAVLTAKNSILIFSDANALLNEDAVKNIAAHYSDSTIGGVAGEKKVLPATSKLDEVGAGEGLYWKYESALKKIDSDFHSVAGAAGELFSLRKSLYVPIDEKVILDDFVMSLKVALKGYRIKYEPDAYAMELPSFSIEDEKKRKVRIAAGGFQAMVMLAPLLAFWKNPRLFYVYFSHRVLRWTLSPLCLIIAFLANLILAINGENTFYLLAFIMQTVFYLLAFFSKSLNQNGALGKIGKIAYYFVFMNICVILGFFRFIKGRQPATWEKVKRSI